MQASGVLSKIKLVGLTGTHQQSDKEYTQANEVTEVEGYGGLCSCRPRALCRRFLGHGSQEDPSSMSGIQATVKKGAALTLLD